jgi:hypothetical protein
MPPQELQQGHVRHRRLAALAREDEVASGNPEVRCLPEEINRLRREGDAMRLARLHPLGRNGPDGAIGIEFVPAGAPDFARSRGGEDQQFQRQAADAELAILQVGKERGHLSIIHGGKMAVLARLARQAAGE